MDRSFPSAVVVPPLQTLAVLSEGTLRVPASSIQSTDRRPSAGSTQSDDSYWEFGRFRHLACEKPSPATRTCGTHRPLLILLSFPPSRVALFLPFVGSTQPESASEARGLPAGSGNTIGPSILPLVGPIHKMTTKLSC